MWRRCALKAALLALAGWAALSACTPYGLPPLGKFPTLPRASDWPDAGVIILQDVGHLEYRLVPGTATRSEKLIAVMDHRRRMKVLRESGLAAADVVLPIDGYSTITRIAARSIAPDGELIDVDRSAMAVEERDNPLERAPDIKQLKFHIPNAQVGGILEYRYERIYVDASLVEPWVFGNPMPVAQSELSVWSDARVKYDYVYGHGEKAIDRPPEHRLDEEGRDLAVFAERDLPGFFHEPFMPHTSRIAPWIAVTLRSVEVGDGVQRHDSWDAIAAHTLALMRQVDIAGGVGTLKERYDLTRNTLQPLLLPGLGVHPPVDGTALVKGAPACSRDATSVLLQSFGGGDHVEAYPALLTGATGSPLAPQTPGTYPFVRVVAVVRVDKRMLQNQTCDGPYLKRSNLCGLTPEDFLFLDPLCKHCAFGVLPNELMGGRALLIKNDTTAWVDMALDPPERHAAQVHVMWEMSPVGALNGILDGELRGTQSQALRAQLALADASGHPADRTATIRDALAGNEATKLVLSGGKLIDVEKIDHALGVFARVASQAELRQRQGYRLRAVDLFGSSIPAEWRPMRRLSAVVGGPTWIETNAEITVPPTFKVVVKPPVTFSSSFADYAAGFAYHDKHLRYTRRFVLKVHTVNSSQWSDFADFFSKVREAEGDGPLVWDPNLP